MGKEARANAAKKSAIKTLMLSERDRFQICNFLNVVVTPKGGHAELRQLNKVYDDLSFDDFPPMGPSEVSYSKRSDDLEPYPMEGSLIEWLSAQLSKEPPMAVGIATLRKIGLVLDRIKALDNVAADDTETSKVDGEKAEKPSPETSPEAS